MADIENKLAAVLAADVAGYSRLMQDDARATVRSLDECRGVFREQVDAQDGRVVDMAGDSVLAVFELATKAVQAAIAIQDALAELSGPAEGDRQMRFRIGIHLGEVLHKSDGTIYGDGVNIAARLESLAEPGGICVSSVVHDVAEGKVDTAFVDAGEHSVKNIARPVRAWHIGGDAGARAASATVNDKPSVVVLPFDNMSRDPDQAYFSDGITEDIITDLSKVPGLFVIARNSAFVYKGKAHDLKKVAADLGVRYVVEGSVRKAGNRVRVTTQLIDGTTGGHVWAERYDRELEDIFAVQDEVTETIVGQLSLHIAPKAKKDDRDRPRNLKAWDLYLRAREAGYLLTPHSNAQAELILREAIALDPGFAAAHAALGFCRGNQFVNTWGDDPEGGLVEGLAETELALELDPEDPYVHFARALVLQYAGRAEEALAAGKRAVELDANNSNAYAVIASAKLALGEAEEALEYFDEAMRLDPYYPNVLLHLCALCHYMLGNYERCRALLEQRLAITTETDSTPFVLAATFGRLGDPEAAKKAWRRVFEYAPDFSVARRRKHSFYMDKKHFDDIIEGLRMAGIDPDVAP